MTQYLLSATGLCRSFNGTVANAGGREVKTLPDDQNQKEDLARLKAFAAHAIACSSPRLMEVDKASTQRIRPEYPQGHPFGPAMGPLNHGVERWLTALIRGECFPYPTESEELFCYCMEPDRGEYMIQCSNGEKLCRKLWFHVNCIGERVPHESEDWFCRDCKAKGNASVTGSGTREPNSLLYTESTPFSFATITASRVSKPSTKTTSLARRRVRDLTAAAPYRIPDSTSFTAKFLRTTRSNSGVDKSQSVSRDSSTTSTTRGIRQTRTDGGRASKRCAHFQKPKSVPWTKSEEDALISVMKPLVRANSPSSSGEKRWQVASNNLKEQYGFDRTANGVKMTWMRVCRERSGVDERLWKFNGGLRTGLQGGTEARVGHRAKRIRSD